MHIKYLLATLVFWGPGLILLGQPQNMTEKIDRLLAEMTLEEKIGQMNQYSGFWDATGPAPQRGSAAEKYAHLRKGWVGSMLNVHGVEEVRAIQKVAVEETRLGIPLIMGIDVIHGYQTIFPIPLAEAASWNPGAIQRSAAAAAREAAAAGINWTFAPMVDISRDARWGRVMEGAGEDPYLGSRVAAARVRGFQGDDLSAPFTIAACAKHFAGYGFAEAGREYHTVSVGMPTFYNQILPPFRAAQAAGVRTFMNAFNTLNGVPSTGDPFLHRELLKGSWGFDGFLVTDWGTISEMINHGVAADTLEAARLAIEAGADMDMESYVYVEKLAELVRDGVVDEQRIDDAVRRILRVKMELGLFEDPYRYCDPDREAAVVGSSDIQEAARDMARQSIVLLKNEDKLLPLPKSGQSIALIGALAADKDSPLGNWRLAGKDHSAVSLREGMEAYTGNTLEYQRGPAVFPNETSFAQHVTVNTTDTSGMGAAVAAARRADVVVMMLGEHGLQSGEGRSRTELGLPGLQQLLLEAVYAVNPNIVLVLQNGRSLALPWAAEHIPAIVEAWHLGSFSGEVIAEVLYGEVNPSGKLPVTFPRRVGQVPLYYNQMNTGRPAPLSPGEVFWSHYIDAPNAPQWPFGFGLSYTTFAYDNLRVDSTSWSGTGTQTVTFELTNTGNRRGTEVAQLYVRDEVASIARPIRELKGFQRVTLEPGERRTLTFELTPEHLGFYNRAGEWLVEPGTFQVMVGGDARADLSTSFTLKKKPTYQLIWADEFSGTELDTTYWQFAEGDGCPNLCGWGNNERQIYTQDNHEVANGYLTITARYDGSQYTSTRLHTKGKRAFQYGKIEARLKLPTGQGVWPAFWMLGSNIDTVPWPDCGEIDIMEYVGRSPHEVHTSIHTRSSHGRTVNTQVITRPDIEDGFHTYAAEWTSREIRFYVDDRHVYTYRPEVYNEQTWPFDQPFYLLLNLAIGGHFGGPEVDDRIFPQSYVVDYVRVYQRTGQP